MTLFWQHVQDNPPLESDNRRLTEMGQPLKDSWTLKSFQGKTCECQISQNCLPNREWQAAKSWTVLTHAKCWEPEPLQCLPARPLSHRVNDWRSSFQRPLDYEPSGVKHKNFLLLLRKEKLLEFKNHINMKLLKGKCLNIWVQQNSFSMCQQQVRFNYTAFHPSRFVHQNTAIIHT